MRMTRHTHNTPHPRHTGPIRTNTTARGARVQGTRDAAYLSTAYGITAHYTSSVPRCVCVAAITAIRPARSSFVPHAACVRRGVGADAAQPDQRDPCAAARHILGSRARATPGPPSGAVGDALAEGHGKRPPPVAAGCRTANAAAGSAPSAPRTPWSPPAAPCAP